MNQNRHHSTDHSRRKALGTAAWGVPAIVAAVGAPPSSAASVTSLAFAGFNLANNNFTVNSAANTNGTGGVPRGCFTPGVTYNLTGGTYGTGFSDPVSVSVYFTTSDADLQEAIGPSAQTGANGQLNIPVTIPASLVPGQTYSVAITTVDRNLTLTVPICP